MQLPLASISDEFLQYFDTIIAVDPNPERDYYRQVYTVMGLPIDVGNGRRSMRNRLQVEINSTKPEQILHLFACVERVKGRLHKAAQNERESLLRLSGSAKN
jgi:UPF0288 family protein (methanogenesis marker protein 3)